MDSNVEFTLKAGVLRSRGALWLEEVGDLGEHPMEDRHGLNFLELAAMHHLLGKLEVPSVLQTQGRADSPHLAQEHKDVPVELDGVLKQVTAQRYKSHGCPPLRQSAVGAEGPCGNEDAAGLADLVFG
ncbi:Hypothetical predicted protein [Marmota monax]|uniref:Uncharacterized protein n=1 Tax=Marmota monax TaxID=9995 RepID=A0A5E4BWP8_MARMO|nr:Hypothetical predicted protein [Marmota monax]